MTIVELLKTENVSISIGDKWLYYDDFDKQWVVAEKKRHKKTLTILIETISKEMAVEQLLRN